MNLQLIVRETPLAGRSDLAHLGHLLVAEVTITRHHDWTPAIHTEGVTFLLLFHECSVAPVLSVPPRPPTVPSGSFRDLPRRPSRHAHEERLGLG